MTEEELLNVTWDPLEKLWSVKFHLPVLHADKAFDATYIIEKYKEKTLGILKISEIQLNNRDLIELYDGELIPREYFNSNPDLEGFYACKKKLHITDDDY